MVPGSGSHCDHVSSLPSASFGATAPVMPFALRSAGAVIRGAVRSTTSFMPGMPLMGFSRRFLMSACPRRHSRRSRKGDLVLVRVGRRGARIAHHLEGRERGSHGPRQSRYR